MNNHEITRLLHMVERAAVWRAVGHLPFGVIIGLGVAVFLLLYYRASRRAKR